MKYETVSFCLCRSSILLAALSYENVAFFNAPRSLNARGYCGFYRMLVCSFVKGSTLFCRSVFILRSVDSLIDLHLIASWRTVDLGFVAIAIKSVSFLFSTLTASALKIVHNRAICFCSIF